MRVMPVGMQTRGLSKLVDSDGVRGKEYGSWSEMCRSTRENPVYWSEMCRAPLQWCPPRFATRGPGALLRA